VISQSRLSLIRYRFRSLPNLNGFYVGTRLHQRIQEAMKFWSVLIACLFAVRAFSGDITRHPESGDDCGCTININGSLAAWVSIGTVSAIAEAESSQNALDMKVSLKIENCGEFVLRYSGELSANGTYTSTWKFGNMVENVRSMTLVTTIATMNGSTLTGTLDGTPIKQSSGQSLEYLNGTNVLLPTFSPELSSALQRLPNALNYSLNHCLAINRNRTSYWKEPSYFERDPSILRRQGDGDDDDENGTHDFSIPPIVQDPQALSDCADCIFFAYGLSFICGLSCSIGFGCKCAGPRAFALCHKAGNGCCPVGCGPAENVLGIPVVYQCCETGYSCTNPNAGECCVPGTTACSFTECCPPSAPCRDSTCCPNEQETCMTSHGPVCCDVGESCVGGVCCIDQYSCGIPGQAPQLCCNPPANFCWHVDGVPTCCTELGLCGNTCCTDGAICLSETMGGGLCCQPNNTCGASVCCGLYHTCANPTTGLCCFAGVAVDVDGICCPPDMINCQGSCCGGTCTSSGCTYTNPQCAAIGAFQACDGEGKCPVEYSCSNGCCFITPT
jgi:hypothetical protein